MPFARLKFLSSIVSFAFLFCLNANSVLAAQETIAILPFVNNSFTDHAKYEPLGPGLSAMLMTDLVQSAPELKVIERQKLAAVLKEVALGQTGVVDVATGVEAGRILGAANIALGSFTVFGPQVRLDMRIVRVETSEILGAESVMGGSDALLTLERQLAEKIAASFKADWKGSANNADTGSLEAGLLYSQAVAAWDSGNRQEAEALFSKCVALDSSYAEQIETLKSAE